MPQYLSSNDGKETESRTIVSRNKNERPSNWNPKVARLAEIAGSHSTILSGAWSFCLCGSHSTFLTRLKHRVCSDG